MNQITSVLRFKLVRETNINIITYITKDKAISEEPLNSCEIRSEIENQAAALYLYICFIEIHAYYQKHLVINLYKSLYTLL